MDPRQLFADERLTGYCVFCGGAPESRDHCPSRVFLDEPLPSNLPVVEACISCNRNFSLDEEYVACLIESVICGSTDPHEISRERIKRILAGTPALAVRIGGCREIEQPGKLIWKVEAERVKRVLLKLARGHVAYELSVPHLDEPDILSFWPLITMADGQRAEVESGGGSPFRLWPEIGSRAFIRASKEAAEDKSSSWIVVQPGRYRYCVDQSDGDWVRIVVSEYLGAHVRWC